MSVLMLKATSIVLFVRSLNMRSEVFKSFLYLQPKCLTQAKFITPILTNRKKQMRRLGLGKGWVGGWMQGEKQGMSDVKEGVGGDVGEKS